MTKTLLTFLVCSILIVSCFASTHVNKKPKRLGFTTEYSWDAAYEYLMYSYSAYCNQTALQSWDCLWCRNTSEPLTSVVTFFDSSTNTFGYAGVGKSQIIVGFRGTQGPNLENWIHNLASAEKVVYRGITELEVAEGFYTAYLSIQQTVLSAVSQFVNEYPDMPVVVVGHSLGAALSELAALDLVESLHLSNVYIWNYGDPRVGNANFASYLITSVRHMFRTINQRDPVPHLPPTLLGFAHSPQEVWFAHNDTSYMMCSPVDGEDPNCSDSYHLDYSVIDHLDYLGFYEPDGNHFDC